MCLGEQGRYLGEGGYLGAPSVLRGRWEVLGACRVI